MKKIVMMLSIALVMMPFTAGAFPQKKGDKSCLDCHKLEKKEAEAIVRKVAPNGTISEIKVSPLKSLWQVEVDAGEGKHGVLYIDMSKKYLIAGQIAPIDQLGKPATPRKVDYSKIPLSDAVVLGQPTAKKKIVVFSDPDCPYCRKLHEELKQVIEKRSDIAFYLILYPLPMHKDAYKKAQAITCEKSVSLVDDAFSGKSVPEPTCGKEQLEKNLALGHELKIEGTPAVIREDGTLLPGYSPADKLIDWIDGKEAK